MSCLFILFLPAPCCRLPTQNIMRDKWMNTLYEEDEALKPFIEQPRDCHDKSRIGNVADQCSIQRHLTM